MSRGEPSRGRRQTRHGGDVVDLYQRLGDGEARETTWMRTDPQTVLWLLDRGELMSRTHPENVAAQR